MRKLDVPFVPSPRDVILEMLKCADVRAGDVLYDLGCGDGRIVIAAARRKEFVRCVGVDIDPRRIASCRENARKARVDGRVSFVEDDLYRADIGEATVVILYLLTSVNLKLRSRLLAELRPGARVLSHDFDMGEWKPDEVSYVNGTMHKVYRWTVPANVSGIWRCNADGEFLTLRINQRFQAVSGSLHAGGRAMLLEGARLEGNRLHLEARVQTGGKRTGWEIDGHVHGDVFEGAAVKHDGGRAARLVLRGDRDPRSVTGIDDNEGLVVSGLLQ